MRTIFVLRRGRLHALPEGMMLAVPTRIGPFLRSGLFSWPGKLRMGLDLLRPRGGAVDDESIASFVRRRFGTEAVERLGEPLMAGIHAGDPERLSIRATFPRFVALEAKHGSLIRGMWAAARDAPAATGSAFYSLAGGLGELVGALVASLPVARRRTSAAVTRLERHEGGTLLTLADGTTVAAQAVVIAVPRPPPRPCSLRSLPQRGRRWPRSPSPRRPRLRSVTGARTSATTWTATASSCPRGKACGARPARSSRRIRGPRARGTPSCARSWAARVIPACSTFRTPSWSRSRPGLGPLLGLGGSPVLERVYRWPRGTPQMEVGHLARMRGWTRSCPACPACS
jgi:oxygen-dependent protoporphyrinogen oxidase